MLSSHSSKVKPRLEIIPETRYVVFDGDEHTAAPAKIRGTLRLTTPESICIKSVTISLQGVRRLGWYTLSGGDFEDKKLVVSETKQLGTTGSHKTNKGVIEWPFTFALGPSTAETVEGLGDKPSVRYSLIANVQRAGWNAKDLGARSPLMVVRTLDQNQLESSRSRINADIWGNKVSYSVSIPSDAVVFGTSIVADVELSPLRKGLRFGDVELVLQESVIQRIRRNSHPDEASDKTRTEDHHVARNTMAFPHDSLVTAPDTVEDPAMEDDRYSFKARLPLPKHLKICRQDVDQYALQITHRLKLIVNIHNPEGHVSQLVCRLPVKLFISPFLPINESHAVQPTEHTPSESVLNNVSASLTSPPVYGSHMLDELYTDIRGVFASRTVSGVATPAQGLSRTGSMDNLSHALQTLPGLADMPPREQLNYALLESRLANLQSTPPPRRSNTSPRNDTPSGPATPYSGTFDAADIAPRFNTSQQSPGIDTVLSGRTASNPQLRSLLDGAASRRSSREIAVSPPHEQETLYDMNTLSRVPSYDAALRTSNTVTASTETPPSYLEATSRPPSPGSSPRRVNVISTTLTMESSPTSRSSASTINAAPHLPEMQVVAPSPIPEVGPDGPVPFASRIAPPDIDASGRV